VTITDIGPRDDWRPPIAEPSMAQADAAKFATTADTVVDMADLRPDVHRFATAPSGYADDAALGRLRDAAVGRALFHMRHHQPTPDRWRRCAEMLALSVENQLRATPGGRLFLANRSNRIPRTWWEATS
jgi:hypothetical protein